MARLVGGVYRKPLPPPAVPLSTSEGRAIFQEALAAGTAEAFFSLIEQFHTQAEPSMCGPATLVMVLNAFSIDPGVLWKGPWRWYDERSLDCCKPKEDIEKEGIEWEEWLCLARCQGLAVEGKRADEGASLSDFEATCAAVCAEPKGQAVVVCYSRKGVGQAGDGHYSPLAAYHRERSMVLLLDTARFKYPPHWLPVKALWEAMLAANASTGRSRGYIRLSIGDAVAPSACCSLKLTWKVWKALAEWASEALPKLISAQETEEAELWVLVRGLPPAVASLVSVNSCERDEQCAAEDSTRCAAFTRALRETRVYSLLAAASNKKRGASLPNSLESLALLVILLGGLGVLDEALPNAKRAEVWKVLPSARDEDERILGEEVQWLRSKAAEVQNSSALSGSCCSFHASPEEKPAGSCCAKHEEQEKPVAPCCQKRKEQQQLGKSSPGALASGMPLLAAAIGLSLVAVAMARTRAWRLL